MFLSLTFNIFQILNKWMPTWYNFGSIFETALTFPHIIYSYKLGLRLFKNFSKLFLLSQIGKYLHSNKMLYEQAYINNCSETSLDY